jgi:hypothetical protein
MFEFDLYLSIVAMVLLSFFLQTFTRFYRKLSYLVCLCQKTTASMMVSGSAQFNRHLQKSRDVPWNVSTTRVLCQASLNSAYVY